MINTSKKSIFLFGLLLPFLIPPSLQAADYPIVVTIQGIQGRLYDNVAASLSIYRKREEKGLSRLQIEGMHKSAPEEIGKALEPFGYYSPEIESELRLEDNRGHALYRVNPGEPVRVSSVNLLLDSEEKLAEEVQNIGDDFPLAKGDILDHTLYRNGKKRLLQQLSIHGYVNAMYSRSEILVNREKNDAIIRLNIQPGPRYLFGETLFEQDLLDPVFLARFIDYEKGEPFSRRKLIMLQQDLYRTNYFGQVIVKGETEKAEGRYIPVSVSLSEPEYFNRYSFGLGYATDHGARAKVGWDNRLFNRHGHSVSSELQIAERDSRFDFIYGIPVRNPQSDKLLFGAGYNERDWEDTETRLFKGGLNYEHTGGRIKYGVGFEVHSEKYEVGETIDESFLPVPNARWSVVYGDDLLNTRNGVFLSVNLKGTAEEILADTTFLQGLISGKLITTPLPIDGLRLIGRFSLGGTLVDSIDDLPPSLRFYAGGDQSVRGYGYNELGSTDAFGTVVGGKYLVFGSVEVEKTVYQNWGVAAFFDVGKGINDLSEDLGEGLGLGLRYRLPFGQIRLDVASAISEDDEPLRLHLTVGGDL
jgi:translocation and assembly module TamA